MAWPQCFDRHDTTYVDLSRLAELKTITWTENALVLGAAACIVWGIDRDPAAVALGRAEAARHGGRLRVIENGRLDPAPVAGLPRIGVGGEGGLLDVTLHPDPNYTVRVFTN